MSVSSIVVMPLLGRAKQRIAERRGSGAPAGEGAQNLLCARPVWSASGMRGPLHPGPVPRTDGLVTVSLTEFRARRLQDLPGIIREGIGLSRGWWAMPGAIGTFKLAGHQELVVAISRAAVT